MTHICYEMKPISDERVSMSQNDKIAWIFRRAYTNGSWEPWIVEECIEGSILEDGIGVGAGTSGWRRA